MSAADARVVVRRVRESDAPALLSAHRASTDLHHRWVSPCLDQTGFDAWFARTQRQDYVSLIARTTGSDRIVGVFNCSQISRGNLQSAYLGYYACAPCAGRGLMAKAMPLVMAYLFDQVGLHRIEANIQPGNLRSIALVRGAGFRLEGFSPRYLKIDGQWRDHQRWALLADEANFSALS